MTNTTSASGLSLLPEGTATITTVHLAIIAVLAVLAILCILWGIRQKRARVQASRDVVEHAKEAGVPPEPLAAPPGPAQPAGQSQRQVQVSGAPVAPTPVAAPVPAPITPQVLDTPVPAAPDPIADERAHEPADEPIAASFEPSPATELAPPAPAEPADTASAAVPPKPAPTADYASEPVTQLKGLGPKVAGRFAELGVTTIGQMAALSSDQAESIDAQLGAFTGRMGRDRWIEQARLLATGDRAGFEAVFGKL